LNIHRLYIGPSKDGAAVLYEARGDEAFPVDDTSELPRNLDLAGVLDDLDVAPPSLDSIVWAVLPRPDGAGGVRGVLDVRAPVLADWGPVWRPQPEVVVTRSDNGWDIDVDEGLVAGWIEEDRIVWDSGGIDSHSDAVAEFLSQPMETLRVLGALKLLS